MHGVSKRYLRFFQTVEKHGIIVALAQQYHGGIHGTDVADHVPVTVPRRPVIPHSAHHVVQVCLDPAIYQGIGNIVPLFLCQLITEQIIDLCQIHTA